MKITKIFPEKKIFLWFFNLLIVFCLSQYSVKSQVSSVELYPNINTIGVIVDLNSGIDANKNSIAKIEYHKPGDSYMEGFPLSRIEDNRFIGSLFWLDPNTKYIVKISFTDPDGGGLNGYIEIDSITTRQDVSIPSVVNNSIYVSPIGNRNSCTLGSPCSLNTGLGKAVSGDEVILRGGSYFEGNFALTKSNISIKAYNGETAILNGSDNSSFTWTNEGNGVYSTTLNIADPHMVVGDGKRLFPYENLDSLEVLARDNIPGFYLDNMTIYVHLENNINPSTVSIEISRFNYAFYIDALDSVFISNIIFKNYGQQGNWGKAIYINNSNNCVVDNCVFGHCDIGIGIKRNSNRNIIQNNEFYDSMINWSWVDMKDVGGLESGGLSFFDPMVGRGTILRNNNFHGFFDGAVIGTSDAVYPGNNGIDIKAPGACQLIYARNNIWSGTNFALRNYNTAYPIDFDYDNFYTTKASPMFYWTNSGNNNLDSLSDLQTVSGQELNGFYVDSEFTNQANFDYTLSSNSLLINAGQIIPGINHNFNGSAPDIGAFEFNPQGAIHDDIKSQEYLIDVFPKPATNEINLRTDFDQNKKINVRIIDIHGKEMLIKSLYVLSGQNNNKLDISDYNCGMYFIIINNNEFYESKKLMIF